MKTKFSEFIKESLRDQMKPKSRNEIDDIVNKYKEGLAVNKIPELLGETVEQIEVVQQGDVFEDDSKASDDEIYFMLKNGKTIRMYHPQDCCEQVSIQDINGDLDDLIGNPLLVAEEVESSGHSGHGDDSSTWTFYKFATVKGYVDIRWLGTSNGYYSESVYIDEVSYGYPYPPKK